MSTLLFIFLSAMLVSLISLIGTVFLLFNRKTLNKILLFFIGLSAGALLSGAFFHLLFEAIESSKIELNFIFLYFISGYLFFLFLEKIIKWRHCHDYKCKVHPFGYMNLIGDFIHNFIDGMIIASSFLISPSFGIITTILIALHEIPQEIGDFGVLVYSGFKVKKVILLNFLTALSCVLGALISYFFFEIFNIIYNLLPFAAGGFLYISSSDLIPIIREKTKLKEFYKVILFFIFGMVIMYFLSLVE